MPLQPRHCRRRLLPTVVGRAMVAAVVIIVGSIFVVGVGVVQPALFSPLAVTALHRPLAGLLVFNILFNYAACILRPPGPVPAHLQRTAVDRASGGRVRRGALDECRYCEPCAFYKPPGAHHCSSCGCCVMELDHHCWYINNCAGAGNLRHFVLFLVWLMAGVGYGLALGLAVGWRDWRSIAGHTLRVLRGSRSWNPVLRVILFSAYWLLSAPGWLACWAYFTVVCLATLAGVGLLLTRQLRLLLRGQSYLDVLQADRRCQQGGQPQGQGQRPQPGTLHSQGQASGQGQLLGASQGGPTAEVSGPLPMPMPSACAAGSAEPPVAAITGMGSRLASAAGEAEAGPPPCAESAAMRSARRVFGAGHPLTWLLPAWDVPPAVGCGRAKVH